VPGSGDHRRADIDRRQAEPEAGQAFGELARTAANLKDRAAGAEPGSRNDEVDDVSGVPEPAGFIERSDSVEQLPLVAPLAAVLLGLVSNGHSVQ
jgi:hypothetical protein